MGTNRSIDKMKGEEHSNQTVDLIKNKGVGYRSIFVVQACQGSNTS